MTLPLCGSHEEYTMACDVEAHSGMGLDLYDMLCHV